MGTLFLETFLAKLEARRAIKSFENVPASDINIRPILEAIRLAPTSFGMQPFTVYVVSSDATKAELSAPSLNQPQVKECSHLLVFAARSDASAVAEVSYKLDNYFNLILKFIFRDIFLLVNWIPMLPLMLE